MNEKYVKLSDLYQIIELNLTFDMLNKINEISTDNISSIIFGTWVTDLDSMKKVPWDEQNEHCPAYSCYCSVCGDWLTASDEYPAKGNFCPNCGATMVDID